MNPEYTTNVTRIRVFDEGDGWAIDGADGEKFTEAVWKYDTREQAEAQITEFVDFLRTEGYTVNLSK
ncbi:MAG: hypothetical protein H9W81_07890 [Enterococcus sp.]|nr:hypothetical protein [Enterococcus sp.]